MKAILITLLALSALGANAMESAKIENFAWLAGTWSSVGGEKGTVEMWTEAAGGSMLGVARTVKNSETVAYEYLRISEGADGGIIYIANPAGQSETTFHLVEWGEKNAVFENLEHDFPQRIIYRMQSDGVLLARVEGEVKGKVRTIDFPMRKLIEEQNKE